MIYKVEFSLGGKELSREEIEELQDAWVKIVEEKDMFTAGGIRKHTKLDDILDWLWITFHG
jgi:hypothetical protein